MLQNFINPSQLRSRARASATHFVFSVILAAACAALVYLLWYPNPLGSMSGVSDLFLLVLEVDVVVVGSCNYDQFVYVAEFPGRGETIYGLQILKSHYGPFSKLPSVDSQNIHFIV